MDGMKAGSGKRVALVASIGAGVLMAAFLVAITQASPERDRRRRAIRDLSAIRDAAMQFRVEKGRYPESVLEILVSEQEGPLGPHEPPDPWGNYYVYAVVGDGVIVKSLGSDGKDGGRGAARDLVVFGTPQTGVQPARVRNGVDQQR